MIERDRLNATGWKRFKWNNGTIIEWWKSIVADSFDYRIGVRFGEYENTPPIVYLFLGSTFFALLHIRNHEQLDKLYSALYNPVNQSMRDFVLSFQKSSEQGDPAPEPTK